MALTIEEGLLKVLKEIPKGEFAVLRRDENGFSIVELYNERETAIKVIGKMYTNFPKQDFYVADSNLNAEYIPKKII